MNKFYLKREEADDVNIEGAASAKDESIPPETPEKVEASGNSNLDEYGYEKVPDDKSSKDVKETKADDEEKTEDLELKEPVAGYGKEPVKEDVVEEPPPAKEEVKLQFDIDVKDLPVEDAKVLKEFIEGQKLPKEAAQALVDLKKKEIDLYNQELKNIETERKTAIAKQRASWDKELRTDPAFGGKEFEHNLSRTEKVLSTLMPETKKALTESKTMLPPYVMRDLLKVYKHMYGTEKLVQGEKKTVEKKPVERSPLDFYNQST